MPAMAMPAAAAPPPGLAAAMAFVPGGQSNPQAGVDQYRSGWYRGNTLLSSQTIQQRGLKLLWSCRLPGHWRGSEHQPLVLSKVPQRVGAPCNVMVAASMSGDVFCFDHERPDPVTGDGREIWKARIGLAPFTTTGFDMYMLDTPTWGNLSCPYADMATMTLYVCAASSVDRTMANIRYFLHAINLTDGSERVPPIDISAAVYTYAGGTIRHDASPRKQRAALGFHSYKGGTQDVVWIADSTFAMMSTVAHGFLVGVNVTGVRSGKPMVMPPGLTWCASQPPYAGAGIWQAGSGLPIDRDGTLWFVGANGAYSPKDHCFGSATTGLACDGETLTVVAAKAYYTDAGREGFDPTTPWIGLVKNLTDKYDGMNMTAKYDQDLGSAPPRLIPKEISGFADDLIASCGKDGVLHLEYADKRMGIVEASSFATDKIQAEIYDTSLATIAATYYNGDFDITPTDLGKFATTQGGLTRHQHSNPPLYLSSDHGLLVYYGGENGAVRAFQIVHTPGAAKAYSVIYVGTGLEIASDGVPPPGGMPGWFMSAGSIGDQKDTAFLVALGPIGNANSRVARARMIVYGANWFAPVDRWGGRLIKIWDSADHPEIAPFDFAKFGHAGLALDKIAVPTHQAAILVFG